jgi:hypothetical protein
MDPWPQLGHGRLRITLTRKKILLGQVGPSRALMWLRDQAHCRVSIPTTTDFFCENYYNWLWLCHDRLKYLDAKLKRGRKARGITLAHDVFRSLRDLYCLHNFWISKKYSRSTIWKVCSGFGFLGKLQPHCYKHGRLYFCWNETNKQSKQFEWQDPK